MSLDLSLRLIPADTAIVAVHSAQIVDAMHMIGISFEPHS